MAAMPPPPPGYPAPQSSVRYGGFWIRFVARVIDAIILGAVFFIVVKLTGAITVMCPADTVDLSTSCPGGVTSVSPVLYIMLAAAILYYPVLWGMGGTLGQRALGLRVADANSGKPIGIGHGVLRAIGYIIATVPIFIGLIWAAFDPRKQGWHDKIASSVVLRK